jgi:DNA polymerase
MRAALQALTDELRRLKAAGVTSVAVSEAGLASLRGAAAARKVAARPARPDPLPSAAGMASIPADVPAANRAPVSAIPARASPAPEAAAARVPSLRKGAGRSSAAPTPAANLFPPPPVVSLPAGDRAARWQALLDSVLADPVCAAHLRPGKRLVMGIGDLQARIFFVGEAPGAEEEIEGEPFVGPAGQLLTKMITGMGLTRSQVYIANVMNWRPELPVGPDGVQSGNRPPTEAEMAYCLPYLRAQIEIVDPAILVALGVSAAQGLLGFKSFRALGEVRGQWREFAGKPLMLTYHPSYILRNPTNRFKRLIWEDLLKVMERAELPVSDKQRGFFLSP